MHAIPSIVALSVLAVLAAAANVAWADDITVARERGVSQASRAEVRTETARARADDRLLRFGDAATAPRAASTTSVLTRAQVRASARAQAPRWGEAG